MYDAGWSVVSWPEEYGGRSLGLFEWIVFEEEYYRAQAPTRVNQNGIFLLAPTLFEFGTPEQKARYLVPMASGRGDLVPGMVGARRRQRPGRHPLPGPARANGPAHGCSTGKRHGARGAPSPTTCSGCSVPIPKPSATGGSRTSSSRSTHRASPCAPSPSSTARRGSPRCSSTGWRSMSPRCSAT